MSCCVNRHSLLRSLFGVPSLSPGNPVRVCSRTITLLHPVSRVRLDTFGNTTTTGLAIAVLSTSYPVLYNYKLRCIDLSKHACDHVTSHLFIGGRVFNAYVSTNSDYGERRDRVGCLISTFPPKLSMPTIHLQTSKNDFAPSDPGAALP
jgi:hypothetical protein